MNRPEPIQRGAVFDLESIAAEMRRSDAYQREGHTARTLVREADLRVVLVVMRAGARIAEHRANDTAAIHALSGHLQLLLPDEAADLGAGQLLVLEPGLAHGVEAVGDSAFLLTLGWRGGKVGGPVDMSHATSWRDARVFTVGHSTRTLDELVAMLRAFDVSVLADVRTIPRSRHNPQFNADALDAALPALGIRYVHLPELGGLRKTRKDSPNTAWRNASFRGFADYMLTEDFEAGLAKLHALAAGQRVAVMCAEAVPWRCHRSLIADALTARGARVEHISSAKHAAPHRMTEFAVVEGARVSYPGGGDAAPAPS